MKRILTLALACALLVTLCSCAEKLKTKSDKVIDDKAASLTIVSDPLKHDEITVAIENKSDVELMFGELFYLEQEINGVWYERPHKDNVAWSMIGYPVAPSESRESVCYITDMYGSLSKGHYRIIKDIHESAVGSSSYFCIAAEFDVK